MSVTGLKSRDWLPSFAGGSRGEPFPHLFQPLEAARIPWLMEPHLQSWSFSCSITLTLPPCLPLPHLRAFVITLGPPG